MKRLYLFIFLTLFIFNTMSLQAAKTETKKYKLLFIDAEQGEPYKSFRENLFSILADFGYKEDVNLEISYHTLDNHEGRAQNIWEFYGKNNEYDAICLSGTLTNKAFKKMDDYITKPIVPKELLEKVEKWANVDNGI